MPRHMLTFLALVCATISAFATTRPGSQQPSLNLPSQTVSSSSTLLPTASRVLKERSDAEITARAKYPDLFKRDTTVTHSYLTTSTLTCSDSTGSPYPFATFTSYVLTTETIKKRSMPTGVADPATPRGLDGSQAAQDYTDHEVVVRRASLSHQGITILAPHDLAAFMMGRGVFKWDNGTIYDDYDYAVDLATYQNRYQGTFHRLYNVVRDSLGNKLLEISVPHFRTWLNTLEEGVLIHLSESTAFFATDVEELVQALLADPDFRDVQYQHYRVNRRFLEAAFSY